MPTAILEYEETETMERDSSLTSNGFTEAEELEILRIVERMHKGEERMYSSEEAWRYLSDEDLANEVREFRHYVDLKLLEAYNEARSTDKRFTHEEVMEHAWSIINGASKEM